MRKIGVAVVAATGLTACNVPETGDLFGSLPSAGTATGVSVKLSPAECKPALASSTWGHVVYTSWNDLDIHRIEARPGADPEDLSTELNRLSVGRDAFVNMDPTGQWLVIGTSRFGCGANTCMALVSADVCQAEVIVDADGNTPGVEGTPAVGVVAGSGGDVVVVFPNSSGPHGRDLFAITKHAGQWGTQVLLTGDDSAHPFHQQPEMHLDGKKVLMDCAPDPGSGPGTDICEVNTDGTGFHTVCAVSDGPDESPEALLQQASYEPGGGVTFEASWYNVEQIWQVPSTTTPTPSLVNAQMTSTGWLYGDDNSPCALPDGRIVSLWLNRPGNVAGNHELKVMNADGTGGAMLVYGVNVIDQGIGCGQ